MQTMTQHPDSLYNEIVKDYEYRMPKYQSIPYPNITFKEDKKDAFKVQLLPKPVRPNDNNPKDNKDNKM